MTADDSGRRDRPGRLGPAEGVYLSMMDAMGVPVQGIGGVDEAVPNT